MDSAKNAPHLSLGIENLSTSSSCSTYLSPALHSPAPQSQDRRVCKSKPGKGEYLKLETNSESPVENLTRVKSESHIYHHRKRKCLACKYQ